MGVSYESLIMVFYAQVISWSVCGCCSLPGGQHAQNDRGALVGDDGIATRLLSLWRKRPNIAVWWGGQADNSDPTPLKLLITT